MPSLKRWRSIILRVIALVAVIQLTLTQFKIIMTYDACLVLDDASVFTSSLNNSASDNISKTDYHLNNVNKSTSLEQKVQEEEVRTHLQQPKTGARFMGHPIYHRSPAELQSFHSTAHCIGDNFIEEYSWKSKTCEFKNLCFDTMSHEFVTFASPEQMELEHVLSNRNLTHFSASTTMLNTSVSIGGLNPHWTDADLTRMKWFPKILDVKHILEPDINKDGGVYVLPHDVVMVPFHSLAGMNVGHLIWDDWLPLYTILETFDNLNQNPLFIRYILEDKQWASCDYHKNVEKCASMMSKFLPLLKVGNTTGKNKLWTIHDFNFTAGEPDTGIEPAKSRYVCSRNGLAGLGMLTDHGINMHGWRPKDFKSSQNLNRGASLYRFRNYMMSNIGVSTASLEVSNKEKFKIVFSINSSKSRTRVAKFIDHANRLKQELGQKYDMEVSMVTLSSLNLVDQVKLMSTTSILVTVCGGGAVSATFLPKGAALFVYFNKDEGHGKSPARLDWDMFNHLGYIRTHWLPRAQRLSKNHPSTIDPLEVDLKAFVKLVDHELDIISHL